MRSQHILAEVASRHHMRVADILSRDRSLIAVAARREAILQMKAAGLCTAVIAGALDRDISTILYHASPKIYKRKCEYRRDRYINVERSKSIRVKIRPEYLAKLAKLAALTDASIEAAVNQAVSDMLESA